MNKPKDSVVYMDASTQPDRIQTSLMTGRHIPNKLDGSAPEHKTASVKTSASLVVEECKPFPIEDLPDAVDIDDFFENPKEICELECVSANAKEVSE